MKKPLHVPVLSEEVMQWSNASSGDTFVDATVGFGGHALVLLPRLLPDGTYLGIDKDEHALAEASERLRSFGSIVHLVSGRFSHLAEIAEAEGFGQVQAVLFDLGVSSPQLDDDRYGISFSSTGALDMRIGMGSGEKGARDIINTWSPRALKTLFTEHGQPGTNRLVDRIVAEREHAAIETMEELVQLVKDSVPHEPGIHPATRVLQALRVEVNREIPELAQGLHQAVAILKPGGRLLAISFHSGEDRVVKEFFKTESRDCICPPEFPVCVCGHKKTLRILTASPIVPGPVEVGKNPRSRSAKLRVAERLGNSD